MITEEKLLIYTKYGGDIDLWARSANKKEKNIMTDNDWYLIDGFVQDISIIRKKLGSPQFEITLNEKLIRYCDGEETIKKLKAL